MPFDSLSALRIIARSPTRYRASGSAAPARSRFTTVSMAADGTCRTDSVDRMVARSITFCSSRTLPGQCHRRSASIVDFGILVMLRPIARENF